MLSIRRLKAQLMIGAIDLRNVSIKAALLDQSTYTYSAAARIHIERFVASSRAPERLPGKTVNLTTGAFDSADPTAQAVTGSNIYRVVLFNRYRGRTRTSRLIMFQDTGVTTVPFTPDGSDVRIVVDAAGWFIL
jgi:hypothetical protein